MKRKYGWVAEDDPGWVRFWAVFPRRDAKLDARKAWWQLNPDAALVDHMVAALFWQVRQPQWRTREFIPLPASWLRGQRWRDDPPAGESVLVDIFGHEPPCQTFAVCALKVKAAREAAQGPDQPLPRQVAGQPLALVGGRGEERE